MGLKRVFNEKARHVRADEVWPQVRNRAGRVLGAMDGRMSCSAGVESRVPGGRRPRLSSEREWQKGRDLRGLPHGPTVHQLGEASPGQCTVFPGRGVGVD